MSTYSVEAPVGEKLPQIVEWKDGKKWAWPLALLIPSAAFVVWAAVKLWGPLMWVVVAPVLIYVVLPVIDAVIGTDRNNPPEALVPNLERDRYYRYVTYAWLPLQYGVLIWACWILTTHHLSHWIIAGAGLSFGIISGISINTAHELGHKSDSLERWLSKIALAETFYGHFYVEHNRGHHVRVATPEDPASARLGESLWSFIPRSVVGSFRSAWELEKKRMNRKGHRTFSIYNDFVNSWAISVVLFGSLIAIFGPKILFFLVPEAIFGFCLLETVNYIEHYGLLRQKRPDGRYEPVTPRESWNSNNVATNVVLFQLQRHSDHHANPTRRYQSLRHFDESPQLPSGYATMILLAYFTPLWRKIMDPKVLAHYDGDVTLANIHGPKREKILAKYGAVESSKGRG